MPLPERCVQEFRDLWREAHGEEIDHETAERQAEAMLTILRHAFFPNHANGPPKNNGPP
jgi:hypothetical protein